MSKKVTRLFEQFQPEHYDVQLQIDPDKLTFSGSIVIVGRKTGRPSQRITLHQKGLKIEDAYVRRTDKKEKIYKVARINNQNSFDEVRLHTTEMIYPGQYNLMVNFSGKISRNMEGIYPCFFKQNGKEQKLIATQFESHHAREAFPCIDEPEAKAIFSLALKTPNKGVAVSNTPVLRTIISDDNTQRMTEFEETPKMSTYLLAFAFGNLDKLEAKTKDGVLVRTFATPDNIKHTKFALETAVKCLEFYNDYFGIDYPLPKCDLVALPDFAAGAMENWGLLTFREQALLVDDKNTSLDMKQYVAMVVAHELAHQWFGNLVTMRWWTDLWLNEGFASWIEYLAVDHMYPRWQMWPQFIASEQQAAMSVDALEHSHPIEVPINHPDEIRTIFDTISYGKGSSVIFMLQRYLGADAFRDGLRLYLKQHAYDNTDTSDLWTALETISKKPVKSFMHAFTHQTGFPLVGTTIKDNAVGLSQQRFLLNPKAKTGNETWPVPLLAADNDKRLFSEASQNFELASAQAFKLNVGQAGFYRTSYDKAHLAKLADLVKAGKLAAEDRMGLLADSFEAAKAGQQSAVDALKLLENYANEDSPVVWDIIAGNLFSIRRVMDDEDLNDTIRPYVRKLVAKQVGRLGWKKTKNESHFDSLLRPTVLGLAAWADEPKTVEHALELFKKAERPEDVEPDIRGVAYGTAARLGGEKEFDKMLAQHNASTSSEARLTLTAALTGFKQPALTKKALAQIDTDTVRLQDAAYWVAYSLGNRYAKKLAWQWLQTHWDWLEKKLGNDMSFSRFPVYAARNFSTPEFAKDYDEFFTDKKSPALERAINQGAEILSWQTAWRIRDYTAIKKFFK